MAESTKEPWHKRIWDVIWKATLGKLWLLFLSVLITWLSQRNHYMPTAVAHPAEYWLATGSVFLGSLSILGLFVKVAGRGNTLLRTWRHPPTLRVVAHGGRTAAVEIQHSGVTVTWEARLRIIKLLNGNPNPHPLLKQRYLEKDGRSFRALPLRDGDTAIITLAEIRWSHPLSSQRETWVVVPNADDERDPAIGDALLELTLTTKPPIGKSRQVKCFSISRISNDFMECSESVCD